MNYLGKTKTKLNAYNFFVLFIRIFRLFASLFFILVFSCIFWGTATLGGQPVEEEINH